MKKKTISISAELRYLEKVQSRCILLSNYLEHENFGRYDDLISKLACVVGTIEDVLNFDNV